MLIWEVPFSFDISTCWKWHPILHITFFLTLLLKVLKLQKILDFNTHMIFTKYRVLLSSYVSTSTKFEKNKKKKKNKTVESKTNALN